MRFFVFRSALLVFAAFLASAAWAFAADSYHIVHTYPHDRQAFTQGLVYVDGYLYESTGLYGRSSLRKEDVITGRILKFQPVPNNDFGEGLTNWGNTLIQLTWKAHTALVYDRATFRFLRSMRYTGEGWGLTQDGKDLILSDGTATLRFLDPATFRELRHITVTDRGKPVTQLNELEWVRGEIYANVWHSNRIARISPATGKVLGWIDLTDLLPDSEHSSPEAVLNGIAYDAAHNRLFVKLWPELFEIQVVPPHAKLLPVRHRN
jgi:glutaminyl-peptide cyclotransferase